MKRFLASLIVLFALSAALVHTQNYAFGPITVNGIAPVVASSPGAGIAHFAGGTQTVTSSLVALASDVSGQLPIGNVGSAGLNASLPVTISAAGAIACGTCTTSTSVLNRVRQAIVSADGSTAVFNVNGDIGAISGNTAILTPTATNGPAIGIFIGATNSVGGVSGITNYRTGRNIKIYVLAGAAGKITDERYWIGVTDQTLAVQGGSDNPAGNYAAFRFSTQAGDSVWQAITKDGTTQNIISTGVAPIISTPQTLAIVFQDSVPNVQFYINGALVATSSSNLPSASTNLRYVLTNECFASTTSNGMDIEQIFTAVDL